MNPNKKRLRRSMMFLNCQKPGLIKDPYVYGPDSIMLDLEDAVAEKEKDAARYSLFHALREIDYRGVERVVRINGLDTDLWEEDIRCSVAGGCDAIRIPKTETAGDVHRVESAMAAAEEEFGVEPGRTLIMAALESARGVMNTMEICLASERLFGIALSGGDYTKDLQTTISGTGVELMGARQHMIIAARAAGVSASTRSGPIWTTWRASAGTWRPFTPWLLWLLAVGRWSRWYWCCAWLGRFCCPRWVFCSLVRHRAAPRCPMPSRKSTRNLTPSWKS